MRRTHPEHISRRSRAVAALRVRAISGPEQLQQNAFKMNSLLERAVDAHGGLDRWNQFTALEAKLSIGGAIWSSKQQPGLLINVTYEIETHEERLTTDGFSGPDRRLAFRPSMAIRLFSNERELGTAGGSSQWTHPRSPQR